MTQHTYTITIEETAPAAEDCAPRKLQFQTVSHDDMLQLAQKAGADNPAALRLLLGVKLLGECILADKENPLFKEFQPHFGAFMRSLKASRQ